MELQGNQGAQAMHPPEASANAAATDDDDDVLPSKSVGYLLPMHSIMLAGQV